MTIPSTPLNDEIWIDPNKVGVSGTIARLDALSRRLERANAVLVEALNRAAENMRIAAAFHVCSNCERGESLARAAIVEAGKVGE